MMSRYFVLAILVALAGCNFDGSSTSATQSLGNSVAVSGTVPANSAAITISGVPATTVRTGQAYSFKPTASDASANVLQFSILNKPQWASFDASTGMLSGTPNSGQTGTYALSLIHI